MKQPNHYGGIVKLNGPRRKPYAVRITTGKTDDGKQIRKYIGYYETENKALKALALYNDDPFSVDTKKLTIDDIYNLWSKQKYKEASASTITGYQSAYKHMASISDKPIRQLKTSQLEDVINNCPKGAGTRKKMLILIRQLYAYAMKNDIIIKDYSALIEVKLQSETPQRPVFTYDEIKALENNVTAVPFADVLLIAIFTGVRPNELLNIKTTDIDLTENIIQITQSKTTAGLRMIPISDHIRPLIEKRLDTAKEYLIEKDDKPINYDYYYRQIFTPIIEALGLNKLHRPHDTRHTFATMLSDVNANTVSIKSLCGHSNYNTTVKHYTHKSIEELRQAINLL